MINLAVKKKEVVLILTSIDELHQNELLHVLVEDFLQSSAPFLFQPCPELLHKHTQTNKSHIFSFLWEWFVIWKGPPLVCHLACGDDPFGYILLKIRPSWQSKNKAAWHTYIYQRPASTKANLKLRSCLIPVYLLYGDLCVHTCIPPWPSCFPINVYETAAVFSWDPPREGREVANTSIQ